MPREKAVVETARSPGWFGEEGPSFTARGGREGKVFFIT